MAEEYDEYDDEAQRARSAVDQQRAEEHIARRAAAYRKVFQDADPDALAVVMADLDAFCRGHQTCFHPDSNVQNLLLGRNEVYRRIDDHVSRDLPFLLRLFTTGRR